MVNATLRLVVNNFYLLKKLNQNFPSSGQYTSKLRSIKCRNTAEMFRPTKTNDILGNAERKPLFYVKFKGDHNLEARPGHQPNATTGNQHLNATLGKSSNKLWGLQKIQCIFVGMA